MQYCIRVSASSPGELPHHPLPRLLHPILHLGAVRPSALGGGDDFCPECGEVLGKGRGKVPLVVKKDELLVGKTGEVKALPSADIEPGRIQGSHEPEE